MSFRPLSCAALLLLASCGDATAPIVQPEGDPAMAAALNDPLMTDPDLVAQNRASHAALLPERDASIPAEDASPRAIATARAEALALVGGPGRMKAAPPPEAASSSASRRAHGQCTRARTRTAAWAAQMPDAFPVYPRAAVQTAAGADEPGCALRTVSFTTPVPPGDVIDFYFTRASHAGFTAEHTVAGGEASLGGTSGTSRFAVRVGVRGDGMTAVELVTSGG